uniref:Uncharacterized protein n=1 Tax=Rhizophora mucronata TaxID=61149 RepID=A0A2P2PS26_RHIMU
MCFRSSFEYQLALHFKNALLTPSVLLYFSPKPHFESINIHRAQINLS